MRYLDFLSLIMHLDAYCPRHGGCTVHAPVKQQQQNPGDIVL